MAIPRILLSNEPEQPPITFAMKCDHYLRRAEAQKALATEMIKNARQMRNRAQQMMKQVRFIRVLSLP